MQVALARSWYIERNGYSSTMLMLPYDYTKGMLP
jgi:hypothetical protein